MDAYREPQFFRMMQYADRADRDVVDMVSGNPDWEPPSALREGLRSYADADVDSLQYPPSVGLRPLREEIASRRDVDVDRVVITTGTAEANHLAMSGGLAAFDGDEIALADPVYPYYQGRTHLLGATPRYIEVQDDGHLDPEVAKATVSDDTAVVVVNSPNNPTGAIYPEETMAALADLVEDHDALLVSDEVYDHFDHAGTFTSALSLDSERVVVTNGFSKSMAITGFRVGYGIFPPETATEPLDGLVGDARTRHMLTTITTSRPAQRAVLEALRETPPDYYADNRRVVADRIERFTEALETVDAQLTAPEGAFYVMARFDGFPGTFENAERLVDEAGVAGMPGQAFGRSHDDWLRFALVTDRVEEASRRLIDFFG